MKTIGAFFATIIALVGGWIATPRHAEPEMLDPDTIVTHSAPERAIPAIPTETPATPSENASETIFSTPFRSAAAVSSGKAYSHTELLAMAGNTFADGTLPLGDRKYVTNAPKKGYIYLCRTMKESGGAGADGPWIKGSTWNINEKLSILGSVAWPNASLSMTDHRCIAHAERQWSSENTYNRRLSRRIQRSGVCLRS